MKADPETLSGGGSHERVSRVVGRRVIEVGFRLLPNKHMRDGNSLPAETKVQMERLSYG
jgi:hypothetical protein